MRLLLLFAFTVITACNTTPSLNYPFSVVSQKIYEDTAINYKSITVNISVYSDIPKETLYLTLLSALEAQHKLHPGLSAHAIKAYASNDLKLKNVLGEVNQGPSWGKVIFECNGEIVTDDRYYISRPKEEKPVLSREEKARQEEVGKFAGEMMKEAEKIRNK